METKEKIEGSDENESTFKKSSGENESIFKETDLMHAVEDEYKDDILTTDVYNKETGSYHASSGTTPAIDRMRKSKKEFMVKSPSDALSLMSPCTQMLSGRNRLNSRNTIKFSSDDHFNSDESEKEKVEDEGFSGKIDQSQDEDPCHIHGKSENVNESTGKASLQCGVSEPEADSK